MEATPRRFLARVAVFPISILAALSLASCSHASSMTANARSNAVPYLCQVIPRVDRLIVTRHAPGSHFRFLFPAVVTVRNAHVAQHLATAACALPKLPPDDHCPAEFSVTYQLDFAFEGEKRLGGEVIVMNASGCETVTGLGATRTIARHPEFYRLLGNALGVKNAGQLTFAGIVLLGSDQ